MVKAPTINRQCPQCGSPFNTSQPSAVYCSRKCKSDVANLEAARGKQLYRLAYGWRRGSGAKFSDLSWLVDQFIREDTAAGRPAPTIERRDHHTTATSYHTARHRRESKQKRSNAQ